MILPDVNVIIAAFRKDAPNHDRCHEIILDMINAERRFGMSSLVLSGFLRIVTNPTIFVRPTSTNEALETAEWLMSHANCIRVEPGERHWTIFCDLCRNLHAKGNLVPDAYFAALAIESDCEWITSDRDYARFPELKWRQV